MYTLLYIFVYVCYVILEAWLSLQLWWVVVVERTLLSLWWAFLHSNAVAGVRILV